MQCMAESSAGTHLEARRAGTVRAATGAREFRLYVFVRAPAPSDRGCVLGTKQSRGVHPPPRTPPRNEATRWPFPPPLVNTPSRDAGRRVRMRATAPSRASTGSRVARSTGRKRSICFPWTGCAKRSAAQKLRSKCGIGPQHTRCFPHEYEHGHTSTMVTKMLAVSFQQRAYSNCVVREPGKFRAFRASLLTLGVPGVGQPRKAGRFARGYRTFVWS